MSFFGIKPPDPYDPLRPATEAELRHLGIHSEWPAEFAAEGIAQLEEMMTKYANFHDFLKKTGKL